MMRSIAILILAWAGSAALAAPPELKIDVGGSGSGPQEAHLMEREFAPGQGSGWHIHHGVELSYVLRGAIQLSVMGQPPRILHAGESLAVPRDVPHEAHAVGDAPATLIVTYTIDKGSPPRIPVDPPAGQ